MNARNAKVTRGSWGVSTTSGSGIKGVQLSVVILRDGKLFKDGKFRFQKGDKDGLILTGHESADALTLEHGYSQKYGRNTSKFVMSRAARKRGMTTDNIWYNLKHKRGCVVSA